MNQVAQSDSILSPNAKLIIQQKEIFLLQFLSIFKYIFTIAFLVGLFSLIFGLVLWFKSQREIDKNQRLQNKKIEQELQVMTPSEVVIKAVEEVEDYNHGNSLNPVQSTPMESNRSGIQFMQSSDLSKVQDYLTIESEVYDKLYACYEGEATLLHNQRIGKAEFDIILQNYKSQLPDFVFEIKYFGQEGNHPKINRAARQASMLAQVYHSTTNRQAIPCVFIVISDALSQRISKEKYMQIINEDPELNSKNINYVIITKNELKSMELNNFKNLLGLERFSNVA